MSSIFTRQDGGGGGGGATFLPNDYVQAKAESRSNLLAVLSFTVVMFGVVAAFMVTNRRWESIREKQVQIQTAYEQEAQKIEQLKALEETRSQMLDKARVTTALIETVPRSILFGEMVLRMPDGLRLDEVKLESKRVSTNTITAPRGKTRSLKSTGAPEPAKPKIEAPKFTYTLSIVGIARQNNDIADYLASLHKCALLSSVELEFIRDTVISEEQLRRFRIVCQLRPDADPEELENIQRAMAMAKPVDEEVEKNFGAGILGRAVEAFINSDGDYEGGFASDDNENTDKGELANVSPEPAGDGS